MAHTSVFTCQGNKLMVLENHLLIQQISDLKGRKSGTVHAAELTIKVEGGDDKFDYLKDAVGKQYDPIPSYELAIYDARSKQELRKYEGTNMVVREITFDIDVFSDEPFVVTIGMTAESFKINGEEQKMNWLSEVL